VKYVPLFALVFILLFAFGCAKRDADSVKVCVSCIPAGCRAVVTPDGKVTYERIKP